MNLLDAVVTVKFDDTASKDIEAFSSKTKSIIGKTGSKIGTLLKNGIMAGTAATVTALGVITKKSFDAYANYEQLVGGVETLFKSSAGTLQAYAAQAYKNAGISANTYMEQATSFSASLIQSLKGNTAAAVEYADMAIIDMSDNANKMGSDIQSIQDAYQGFAKANFTMLDNLKLGYGGTQSEMQRLIDDANRVKEAHGEMGDLTIESFADIVEAIHLMQEEMGIAGATAEEAATTVEGSINMMKASWENWLVALADPKTDVAQATDELIDSVITAAENAVDPLLEIVDSLATSIGERLPEIFGEIGTGIANAFPPEIRDVLLQIGEWVNEAFTTIAESPAIPVALEFLTAIKDGLLQLWQNIQEYLLPVFAEFGGVLEAFFLALEPYMPFFERLAEAIGNVFMNAIIIVMDVIGVAIQVITRLLDDGKVLVEFFQNLPNVVAGIVPAIVGWFSQLKANVANIFHAIITVISTWASSIVSKAVSAARNFASNFINGITSLPSKVITVGRNIIDGLIQGITGGARRVVSSLTGIVGDAISAAKNLLGIHSPSRVFKQIGDYTMQGFALGIDDGALSAVDSMNEAVRDVEGAAAPTFASREASSARDNDTLRQILEVLRLMLESSPDGLTIDGREFARLVKRYA